MTTDHARLEAAARRALQALSDLILDNPDPGVEALGAQYELRQALLGEAPEIPTEREWTVESRRANGQWSQWSAPYGAQPPALADYTEAVADWGHERPYRLVCDTTTRVIEARHEPQPDDGLTT